jgi:hypothetical protein
MATRAAKATEANSVEITAIATRVIAFNIVGTTPLIMHRYSRKAWEELLLPSRKKNQAAKDASLKHDPLNEYRESCYVSRSDDAPTLFHLPTGMIHGAVKSAALDMAGARKTEVGRWVSVSGSNTLFLYGVPQLYTAMARNSGMDRTPDVRTRAIFPQWALSGVALDFKLDPLTDASVLNLMAAAGVTVGLGDWRPQRGGSFGKFRLCNDDDPEFQRIIMAQGRGPQQAAYADPDFFDDDTRDINLWFREEIQRRDRELPSDSLKKAPARKLNGHGDEKILGRYE